MENQVFDGREVTDRRVKITNAGDGLSKALHIDPQDIKMGQKVFVVLECEAMNVTFVVVPDDDTSVVRVQALRAGTGIIVDEALVGDMIRAQAEKNRVADERSRGIMRLPYEDDDGDVLMAEHEEGRHATTGLVEGCGHCDSEAAAMAAEEHGVQSIADRRKGKGVHSEDGESDFGGISQVV